MRRLLPLALFAVLPGCTGLFVPSSVRAVDACREAAQNDGWRVTETGNARREGTAYRVEVRGSKLLLGTRTLVCYYDPATRRATIG